MNGNHFLLSNKKMKCLPLNRQEREKVDKVILFTNARNEKHMKEWAAHHLLIGFDFIYIFDHKSNVPLKNEFKNFDKRVIVERCEWNNPVKIPLMNMAVKIAKNIKADWMLYLDADEFLMLNTFPDVKKMLHVFNFADSLAINWLMFGTNHHTKEPSGMIIDNYTKSELILDKHVKCFVRPSQVKNTINPHYYIIQNSLRSITMNNKICSPPSSFNEWNVEFYKTPAFIAHYVYQCEETYIKRKINLPKDDDNGYRKIDKKIHTYHNVVENHLLKEKYSHLIKEFLEKYK
jgi:hypothetical protein